jgi:A/G-specific adenine glycosylase
MQGSLPKKKSPEPVRIVEVYTGILIEDGRVLAMKRPSKGLLAAMWEFPSAEAPMAPAGTTEGIRLLCAHFQAAGHEVSVDSEWRSLTHTFSHREWRMRIFLCKRMRRNGNTTDRARWLDLKEISETTWAGPHRKVAAWIGEEFGDLLGELLQEKGK